MDCRVRALLLALLLFTACKAPAERYEQQVEQVSRIDIHFIDTGDIKTLYTVQTESFKQLLIHNVQPELPRKFAAGILVYLYKGQHKVAMLRIYPDAKNPFANYASDKHYFGFRMPPAMVRLIEGWQ